MLKFCNGDTMLVAIEAFNAGEKLSSRCCGPGKVMKALNDYLFEIRNLENI